MQPLDIAAALAWAAQGIPIFPLNPGLKKPAITRPFDLASTDPAQITAWAEQWPGCEWGFEPAAMGWYVVDADPGSPYVDETGTWGQKTRRGRHWFYTDTHGLRNTVKRIAPETDGRGWHGVVKIYSPEPPDAWELRPVPPAVVEACGKRDRTSAAAPSDLTIDDPQTIDWFASKLRQDVAEHGKPVDGEGSDDRAFNLIGSARDGDRYGYTLSPEKTSELMAEHWAPHFDTGWLDEKTYDMHAPHRYQNAPGCGSGGSRTFGAAVEALRAGEAEDAQPIVRSLREMQSIAYPAPEWLWQGRFNARLPNLLTGDLKVGKTVLMKNLAVCVAAGIPCLGRATKPMEVVLLVGEDMAGPYRDDLLEIIQTLGVPPETADRIFLRSVLSDPITGGPRLAIIDDQGHVGETPFARQVIEQALVPRRGNCLFGIDPLEKFIGVDRNKDAPARAVHDGFLEPLSVQLGITSLIADHPSRAGMQAGEHSSGSKQLRAPFAAFATLRIKDGQRILDFRELRYGPAHEVPVYRDGDNPTLTDNPFCDLDPELTVWRVYRHIVERLDNNETTGRDGNHSYGPAAVAIALKLTDEQVRRAMGVLAERHWLVYLSSRAGSAKRQSGWYRGNVAPMRPEPITY